jgi:hypothetical protein
MEKHIIKHVAFSNLFLIDNGVINKYFDNINNFDTLIGRIDRVSKKIIKDYWSLYPPEIGNPDVGLLRLKGDIFEIFVEALLKLAGSHPSLGVYNYVPVVKANDWGVDGSGIGLDGSPLTVQVKYRSDPKVELLERDIKQFPLQSFKAYDVDLNTSTNLLLIASCEGLSPITASEVFFSQITVINRQKIAKIVNKNFGFWHDLTDLINNTIKVKFGSNIKVKSLKEGEVYTEEV